MKKGLLALGAALSGVAVGIGIGAMKSGKVLRKEVNTHKDFSEKHLQMFHMMNQWVKTKQEGKQIRDYLESAGYKTIAIYGMSYVGQRLYEELVNSNIVIKYGIDRNADSFYSEMKLYTMNDDLEPVDAVIVTPIHYFDEIATDLSEKLDCPIISLEDLLYDL